MKFSSPFLAVALMTGVAATGAASAADMYSMRPTGYAVSETDWAGTYLGAHLGGASGTVSVHDVNGAWCPAAGVGCSYDNNANGVLVGGQVGYNVQHANYVLGPEWDLGYMDLSKTKAAPGHTPSEASSKVNGGLYTAVTGRVGYNFKGALVFAKGGWAYYSGKVSNHTSDASYNVHDSGLGGWTLGAGAEYKINSSWSLKVEYLHFDFGTVTNTFPATGRAPERATSKTASPPTP